ncbi:MAG: AsnC family transcriptional regulator [Deltaproteobacteria bacterium]|nr:AsnC family transcriptional regulator [Deltaproteobacteria bacterium]
MDAVDKKILNIIQKEFPVHPEPFNVLAGMIGITEDEALARVTKLKNDGIIRRIGAVFNPKKLGFSSTLCAAHVPPDKLKDFVETVNACPGVTHNYRRNHAYNVWFTFIAPSEEAIEQAIEAIKAKTGIEDIINMKAVRTFKINAIFPL